MKESHCIWLAVPPEEKDEAINAHPRLDTGQNAIGWDKEHRLWYARPGVDLNKFERWIPRPQALSMNSDDPVSEFAQVLENAGLVLRGLPVMDGSLQRVPTKQDKKGSKSGAYKGFTDGRPAGWYRDYRSADEKATQWVFSGGQDSDPRARLHLRAQAQQTREDNARALAKQYRRQADYATRYVSGLPQATTAPYLIRKGVQAAEGVRLNPEGELVIPFSNAQGHIRSYQRIPESGGKDARILKDSEKTGNWFTLGSPVNGQPVLFAEGYATAASLHESTGLPVLMTIDASNMIAVAQNVRAVWPDSPFLFCADNDHQLRNPRTGEPENKGILSAEKAAVQTNGRVLVPALTDAEREQRLTDFNDLDVSRGRATFQQEINAQLISMGVKTPFSDRPQLQETLAQAGIEHPSVQDTTMEKEDTRVNTGIPQAVPVATSSAPEHVSPTPASLIPSPPDPAQEAAGDYARYTQKELDAATLLQKAEADPAYKDGLLALMAQNVSNLQFNGQQIDAMAFAEASLRRLATEAKADVAYALREQVLQDYARFNGKELDAAALLKKAEADPAYKEGLLSVMAQDVSNLQFNGQKVDAAAFAQASLVALASEARLDAAYASGEVNPTPVTAPSQEAGASLSPEHPGATPDSDVIPSPPSTVASDTIVPSVREPQPGELQALTDPAPSDVVAIQATPDEAVPVSSSPTQPQDRQHILTAGESLEDVQVRPLDATDATHTVEPEQMPQHADVQDVPPAPSQTATTARAAPGTSQDEAPEQAADAPQPDAPTSPTQAAPDANPDSQATAEPDGIVYGPRRPEAPQKEDLEKIIKSLTWEEQSNNTLLYRLDGQDAFRDLGNRIEMCPGASQDDRKVLAALAVAAKFYGGVIELTGSPEFKEKAMQLIVEYDLDIRMKLPAQRAQLDELRKSMGTSQDAVVPHMPTPDLNRQTPDDSTAAGAAATSATAPTTPTGPVPDAPIAPQASAPDNTQPVAAQVPADPAVLPAQAEPSPPAQNAIQLPDLPHEPAPTSLSPGESVTAVLIDYGEAMYENKEQRGNSFFIELKNRGGSHTYWGQDLRKLIEHHKKEDLVTLTLNSRDTWSVRGEERERVKNNWSLTAADTGIAVPHARPEQGQQVQSFPVDAFGKLTQQIRQAWPEYMDDLKMPQRLADRHFWLGEDRHPVNTPHNAASLSSTSGQVPETITPIMASMDSQTKQVDLLLVQSAGEHLQGVVRLNGTLYPALATPTADNHQLVINAITDSGPRFAGYGQAVNFEPDGLTRAAPQLMTFHLKGREEDAPLPARLYTPEKQDDALFQRLGFEQTWTQWDDARKPEGRQEKTLHQEHSHSPGR